jgi:hypothetical protein
VTTTTSPPVGVAPELAPRRRGRLLLGALAALAAIGAVVLVVTDPFTGSGTPSGVVDNTYPTGLATVTRRSLSSQTQVSATLGYADPGTIVAPSGTAPSALEQSQQSVSTAQGQLQAAEATLAADERALLQTQATLAAARQKLAVDCTGDNAGQAAASGGGGGGSGGSAAGACAADMQGLATDEQAVTQTDAKVATDRQQVSSATTSLSGAQASLAAGETSAAIGGQSSTYTELPAVGQVVARGRTLYEVSGQPVVLLYGSVAPWRAFAAGMSPGRDVAELNANLQALGYGRGLAGDRFTSATTSAIEAFQHERGLAETGRLPLGSVVFEPGAVRVTSVTPTLGATVQPGPVLGITSTRRDVSIQLDASQQADVKVGDPVAITLPDNSTTPGRVSYVGTVATVPSSGNSGGGGGGGGGGSGTPTIEVDVTPTDPAATGRLDQAPVNVSITTGSVANALVVPVNALLALASGGYAVEEAGAGGVHHLVGVELGVFDDASGYVQVSGTGLAAGQRVVVPST